MRKSDLLTSGSFSGEHRHKLSPPREFMPSVALTILLLFFFLFSAMQQVSSNKQMVLFSVRKILGQ